MSREVRRRAGECERDEDSIKSSSQPASVARTGKLRKVDGGRVTKATGSKENKRRACEAQKLGEAHRRQHTERQRDAGCRVASSAGCGGSRGCRVVRRVVDPEVSVRHGRGGGRVCLSLRSVGALEKSGPSLGRGLEVRLGRWVPGGGAEGELRGEGGHRRQRVVRMRMKKMMMIMTRNNHER
jgi:hypothetical protein